MTWTLCARGGAPVKIEDMMFRTAVRPAMMHGMESPAMMHGMESATASKKQERGSRK